VVFLADRDAAAGQNQVVVLACALESGHRGIQPVGHYAQIGHAAAEPVQQGLEEEAVGVIDSAGFHVGGRNVAGHDQFVTGGEQGHARPPGDLQPVKADAGGQAERGRAQAGAAVQHHRARGNVFTAAANPLPRPGLSPDANARMQRVVGRRRFAIFLHDHGIGAGRNRRARENPRHASRRQGMPAAASRNTLADLQHAGGADPVSTAHGITVHRTVVVRGHSQA